MNFRLAVAAVAGATLLTVATPAATATTSAPGTAQLPIPNRALATTVSVDDARLTVGGTRMTVDLEGRAGLIMVSPSTGQTRASAKVEQQLSGTHPVLGRITVTTESTAEGTVTYNSLADPFPARLDLPSDVTVEIEHAPRAATRSMVAEPLVLTTREPGRLTGSIADFPPDGDMYRLQNPVDLALSDGPDPAIATLDSFSVQSGGL